MRTKNLIFLLGGQDLEMQEIANLLEGQGIIFFDKHLTWDTAKLSCYQEELKTYSKESFRIYGVELSEDITTPENYTAIDHHNGDSSPKSSLEQVADLLHLNLSRIQTLIAANDSAYIPGLKACQATQEEIEDIRRRDRKAQGVTEEEETAAEQAIKNSLRFDDPQLWVIRSESPHFSPICDRIPEVQNILIHTDSEWTFYGFGRNIVKEFMQRKCEMEKQIYWGGSGNGYIGRKAGTLPTKMMKQEIEEIINLVSTIIYSSHVFYFPFIWKNKKKENWDEFAQFIQNKYWERNQTVLNNDSTESRNLYDEANFFYKFIHPVLYDFSNNNSFGNPHILHLERKEPKEQRCQYRIIVNGQIYTLDLRHINLNFYRTGVGMLSFFLENRKYPEFSDILKINQYGRRIFPPFFGDIHASTREQLAEKIEIIGLNNNMSEDFKNYRCHETWKPAAFIEQLITDYTPDINIDPVIDDRMFVTCWYQNTSLTEKITNTSDYTQSQEWFRYIFLDTEWASCQDDKMMTVLLEQATNPRWRKYGTMYGITPYSFMALTSYSEFATNHIRVHVNTIYSRMVELVLMQRASILKFNKEVGDINLWENHQQKEKQKELQNRIKNIYRDYIFFINQMYYLDVTAQEQGTALYRTLQKQLDLERQAKDLDDEIGELHNYISVVNDQMNTQRDLKLNWMATIFLPATIITGLFGMNKFEDLSNFWCQLLIALFATIIFYVVWNKLHLLAHYWQYLLTYIKKKL